MSTIARAGCGQYCKQTQEILLREDAYGRDASGDDRFVDYFGSVQSIVTSSANSDSGMFETNLHDERFLPFEGAGAIGTWRLELPRDFRLFDYATISDAILHMRYTARSGGDLLGDRAVTEMREMLSEANRSGLALLFELRHDSPTEWSAFVNGEVDFTMPLRKDRFPYMVQGKKLAIDDLTLYAQEEAKRRAVTIPDDLEEKLNDASGLCELSIPPDGDGIPPEDGILTRDPEAQVFLILRYRLDE